MTDELRYTQERAHRTGQAALWDRGKAGARLSRPAFRTRSAAHPRSGVAAERSYPMSEVRHGG